ncbi:MAG: xanthine dehydrogenase family protein molybdopterin-binding subunit [Rhizobiaceae bacterium]|nr:xanthine dehydrogenase family protein molybdopterin-binding subunit [Rhizobiaceae bacterium]
MNAPVHGKFGMGASPRRKEDVTLITGRGNFTDDNVDPNLLHGYVLRSPHAHAKFKITDVSAAKAVSGVHAVMIAADVAHLKPLTCQALLPQVDGTMVETRDIPILCEDTVLHVGDAVAFIVADSVLIARDAAELIEVDYDIKDAIADTATALDDGVAQVYADKGGNLAFTIGSGDPEKTKAILEGAAHVSELTVINNRLVSNYIEPRSCVADWSDEEDRFNLSVCSQGVHGLQGVLIGTFDMPKEKIHVTTGDVGGGFGTKAFVYREYPLAMAAAKLTGKQVKWTCDRTEHFVVDAHGRDNVVTARMAMDKDGKFLALDIDLVAAMGAYLHCYGPFIPFLGGTMATGLYDIDTLNFHLRGVYTHTTPVDAYRGAGRPEAAYLIERLVDQCALDMKMTRDEIRRRNFIKPEQLPYTTQGGRMYDTGEFVEHMEECMERSKWDEIEARNDDAKKNGKFRGIGMATYIEACAFAGSEPAFLELQGDGTVTLKIGTQTNGQGHATAYAQLAADNLGLDIDEIDVRQGDTDELAAGGGTGGSRSVPLGGVSVVWGSQALAEKIKNLAADKLEASAGDIELIDGEARVVGTDSSISLAALAQSASNPDDLKGEGNFKQAEATYPNGTHICEVEVDPTTGVTKVVAYTIVDDFGVTVNPILLAGQVHGGVAQGIGQCLNEHTVYDEDGQLLTASFMDYCMPRAEDIPHFNFNTRNVPSTTNALGIKGAGEAGTIGACPAVMNAVCDALHRHNGTESIDMPVTPLAMWNVLNA